MPDDRAALAQILLSSPWHAGVLSQLEATAGDAAWIGAGFVRNAVWDAMDGRPLEMPEDVDVLIHRADQVETAEIELQHRLQVARPDVPWSVRNQARMHTRHGDAPYPAIEDAMRRWPETATAVAVRLDRRDGICVIAPFGLSDLLNGVLRPTDRSDRCRRAFDVRLAKKGWAARWPRLVVEN